MKRGTPRGEVGRYHKEGSHWVHWAGQKVHSVFSIPSHRKTLMNFLANPINAEEERWVFGWTHPPKWTHHFVSFSSSVVLVWVSIFSFGIKDTQILMARVSHFCPTCGYSNILSNMKSNSAIHWYKCFLGFHISWRTKLKLSGTRWNFFKKKKKDDISFTLWPFSSFPSIPPENFSPGKCSVDGLTPWKLRPFSQPPCQTPHLHDFPD